MGNIVSRFYEESGAFWFELHEVTPSGSKFLFRRRYDNSDEARKAADEAVQVVSMRRETARTGAPRYEVLA